MEEKQTIKIDGKMSNNNATNIITTLINQGFSINAKEDESYWKITGSVFGAEKKLDWS